MSRMDSEEGGRNLRRQGRKTDWERTNTTRNGHIQWHPRSSEVQLCSRSYWETSTSITFRLQTCRALSTSLSGFLPPQIFLNASSRRQKRTSHKGVGTSILAQKNASCYCSSDSASIRTWHKLCRLQAGSRRGSPRVCLSVELFASARFLCDKIQVRVAGLEWRSEGLEHTILTKNLCKWSWMELPVIFSNPASKMARVASQTSGSSLSSFNCTPAECSSDYRVHSRLTIRDYSSRASDFNFAIGHN